MTLWFLNSQPFLRRPTIIWSIFLLMNDGSGDDYPDDNDFSGDDGEDDSDEDSEEKMEMGG